MPRNSSIHALISSHDTSAFADMGAARFDTAAVLAFELGILQIKLGLGWGASFAVDAPTISLYYKGPAPAKR